MWVMFVGLFGFWFGFGYVFLIYFVLIIVMMLMFCVFDVRVILVVMVDFYLLSVMNLNLMMCYWCVKDNIVFFGN